MKNKIFGSIGYYGDVVCTLKSRLGSKSFKTHNKATQLFLSLLSMVVAGYKDEASRLTPTFIDILAGDVSLLYSPIRLSGKVYGEVAGVDAAEGNAKSMFEAVISYDRMSTTTVDSDAKAILLNYLKEPLAEVIIPEQFINNITTAADGLIEWRMTFFTSTETETASVSE